MLVRGWLFVFRAGGLRELIWTRFRLAGSRLREIADKINDIRYPHDGRFKVSIAWGPRVQSACSDQ